MDLSDSLTLRKRRAGPSRKRMTGGFIAIIAFKYFKACLFLVIGFAALRLARMPSMPTVDQIARFFRSDPENQLVRRCAELLGQITPGQAIGLGVVSLLVGLVFAAEGTFLAARIWWSTYFTIVLTALGIPLELYEIGQRLASVRRYVILAINAAILVYVWRRRNEFREHQE